MRSHIVLESPTLKPGQLVPREHTTQGANRSPALSWRDVPPGTKQLAVALIDRDTHYPGEAVFLQWMVYGIPATATGLPVDLPATHVLQAPRALRGAVQARTHFDVPGYRGPQPPVGELHRYRFVVYALNAKLVFDREPSANRVLDTLTPHIIGEGEIAVTYRQTP